MKYCVQNYNGFSIVYILNEAGSVIADRIYNNFDEVESLISARKDTLEEQGYIEGSFSISDELISKIDGIAEGRY